jgi:predicted permease
LRSAVVVAEVAIALVLLNTSGAFLRSFQRMQAVNPGFRPDHVLVAGYQLPLTQYSTRVSADNFNHAVIDKLSTRPGIVAVGIGSSIPAAGGFGETGYTVEDEPAANWKLKFAAFATTYGEYFRALDVPLVDGRYFTKQDLSNHPPVVIVSQSMARHSWPGQRAIGRRMHAGSPEKKLPWATVIGVVADTKLGSRDEPSIDQWYMPAEQPAILYGPESGAKLTDPASEYIALRSALPPEEMRNTLRTTIAEIDSLLALQQVQPMTEAISSVEEPRRFNTNLVTAFAASALLLAITGTYAVVAFSVSLRSHEIAIRMVLGARRAEIGRLVLISGAKLALLGCGIGVLGSLAASGLVSSFLFEVSATESSIYTTSTAI